MDVSFRTSILAGSLGCYLSQGCSVQPMRTSHGSHMEIEWKWKVYCSISVHYLTSDDAGGLARLLVDISILEID
jgi:hypothetical protein